MSKQRFHSYNNHVRKRVRQKAALERLEKHIKKLSKDETKYGKLEIAKTDLTNLYKKLNV